MKTIGITNTIPSEIIYAAGHKAMDLNNVFIMSGNGTQWIESAESDGFPKSMCAWIKGVYAACLKALPDVVVGVMEGDCSNTKVLYSILNGLDISIVPFSYPHDRNPKRLQAGLSDLMTYFGVTEEQVEAQRLMFHDMRQLGYRIDRMTYETNQITGWENHLSLVGFSDFNGNPSAYKHQLEALIAEASQRPSRQERLRIAYIGVPPMFGDLYEFVECHGGRVVFNEVQREFAFLRSKIDQSLTEQYLDYTYPYDWNFRIDEIKSELRKRQIDGIIHYTQAFCHRGLEDLLLRRHVSLPILTIEGDKTMQLDARTKLRIEAFLDMLEDRRIKA